MDTDSFHFDFEGYQPPQEQKLDCRRSARAKACRTRWDSVEGKLFIRLLTAPFARSDPKSHMKGLLDDLLTDKEWDRLSRRARAAQLIYLSAPFKAVRDMTGLSNDVLSLLSKKLYSKDYGLREMLRQLRREEWRDSRAPHHKAPARSPSP